MQLAALPAILTAVGSVVSGFATYQAAQANAAQQQMTENVANENARRAIERSQIEQQDQDIQTKLLLGEQMAQQAGSGVNVGFGSTLYTRRVAREMGRRDALNVRQSGEIEAGNFKNQAASARLAAGAARTQGALGLLGGFLNAGSAIGRAEFPAARNYAPTPPPRPRMLS